MLNKIFFGLLAVATIGVIVLMYFQYSWLQSITNPADVKSNYIFYNSLYWSFLWISSLALLIYGNVILWKERKSWALWTTFLYFAVFVILQTWWIGRQYFNYKVQNNLTDNDFSLGAVFGTLICILVAMGIFFDQFLVLRARDRIHGEPQQLPVTTSEDALSEDPISEKKSV